MDLNKTTTIAINQSNPGLTGNVKIVTDLNNNVFLNSIQSNEFISKEIYNKIKIDPAINFNYSISKFLTQEKIIDLNNLYLTPDITQFNQNCYLNTNTKYPETFRYFAPLFIHPDKGIPDYFIVFKKDNDNWYNSSVVKVFNLINNNFGKIFNNDYIKTLPKTIWYQKSDNESYYYFNGIAYQYSTLSTIFKILENNWDISIFQTIDLLSANYFNFEFMFNDNDQTNPEAYIGKYFFKEELFRNIDLNTDLQNLLFDYKIEKNNFANLDISKFSFKNGLNNIYIKNDINIPLPSENSIYGLNDKNNDAYIIHKLENSLIKLNSDFLDYYNLFGVVNDSFKKLPATVLDVNTNSISVQLIKNSYNNIINISDYLELDCVGYENFKYRVIASDKNCCSPIEVCKNIGNNYYFKSESINIETHNNINIIKIKCNNTSHIPIEIDAKLKISCNLFNNKYINVDNVIYNFDNKYFEIIFIDYNNLFYDIENIGAVLLNYTEDTYYYTFFNPYGSASIITKRIVEAFRKFNLDYFDFTYINDLIIIKNKSIYTNFNLCNLNINVGLTNTLLSNFIINGQVLTGTKFYDNFNNLIINKKFASCQLNGDSDTLGSRVAINKNLINDLTGNEIFICNQGLKKLNKFIIDNNKNFKSMYIDEPIIDSNYIKNYNNINNYYVLTVDDIFTYTENNYINYYNEFKPDILKLSVVLNFNI